MRKVAAISTVITAIILLITLVYQFYFNEIGPTIGDDDNYDLHVIDRMAIINTIGSLVLKPKILIRNDGTLPVRITKVMALLQVGDHFEVFRARFIANILPHNVWLGEINLEKRLVDEDLLKRDKVNIDIVNFLMEKFKKNKSKEIPIFLNQELLKKVGSIYESNASFLKKDDNYYLLLMFWMNDDGRFPSKKYLRKFKFSAFQKKLLTEYQLNASISPRPDIIPSNLFIPFSAMTNLKKLKDRNQAEEMYKKYKELVREN